MEVTKQEENIKMYREYGISEWREKCLVLSDSERAVFLYDLQNGRQSDLVTLVSLPFPQFITVYCKRFHAADPYTIYPDFGFKMYMLKDSTLRIWTRSLRDPKARLGDLKKEYKCVYDRKDFNDIIHTPFNEIPKVCGTPVKTISELDIKYAYISQYIDTQTALEMELPIGSVFEQEENPLGFDLQGKLKTLNPIARTIISRTLGLYGYDRTGARTIAKELKISEDKAQKCVSLLFPVISRTLGDFKNKTGYLDPQATGNQGLIEYKYSPYRDLDIALETQYIKNNLLTPAQLQVLSSVSNSVLQIYLAAKFFGWTDEQICRNLLIIKTDLETIKGSIEFHG